MIVYNFSEEPSEDVIYLSLTCVYFFRLLGPIVQGILAEDTAPWAGDRLIFVGNYAYDLDIGDICTSKELRRFKETRKEHGGNPFFHIQNGMVMCTADELSKADPGELSGYDLRRAGALEQRVREKLTPGDLELYRRLSAIVKNIRLSADHSKGAPVLRNLTAKEYVRDNAMAESDYYAYGLGEVFAAFTLWKRSGPGKGGLDRVGNWAGQRLDIATMADISEESWTDVSQLAVDSLRKAIDLKNKDGKRVECHIDKRI